MKTLKTLALILAFLLPLLKSQAQRLKLKRSSKVKISKGLRSAGSAETSHEAARTGACCLELFLSFEL